MESCFYGIYFPEKKFLIAVIRNHIPGLDHLSLSGDIPRECDRHIEIMNTTMNKLKDMEVEAGAWADLERRRTWAIQIKNLCLKADLIVPAKMTDPPVWEMKPDQSFMEIIDPLTENILYYAHRGSVEDFILDEGKRSLARIIFTSPLSEGFQAEDLVTMVKHFPAYLDNSFTPDKWAEIWNKI